MVRRVAEYKIRSTIRRIVINLLATKFFGGFLIQKTNRSKTMKSKIFITGAVLCAITTGAHAVTKCVALNSSTTCTSTTDSYNTVDWGTTCITNNKRVNITGIGGCGTNYLEGGNIQVIDKLETSDTSNANIYCWCKMTSPATTPWISAASYSSVGTCLRNCAHTCTTSFDNDSIFRDYMIFRMSD